jgi:hypothetical protein
VYKNANWPIWFLSKGTHETMQNETANLFMTNSAHLRSHSRISDGENHTILLPQHQAGFGEKANDVNMCCSSYK